MHLVELPRLREADADDGMALVRWARFLRARNARELESLAEEDPIMAEAKDALERLSHDEAAHYLAEARLKGNVYLAAIKQEGHEEGRRAERAAIATGLLSLLSSRGVAVSVDDEARIRSCDDTDTLLGWIARAASVTRVDELFAE